MKVLHVIPSVSAKHGGPSVAVKSIATASKRAGMQVAVATTDDDGDDARLKVRLGSPIERDGIIHFFFRRDFVPYKISFGLARWLNRHVRDFDLVHIHALFSFSSLAAARAAQKSGAPYVVRPLGVLNKWGLENRKPFLKSLSLRLIELPILRRAAAIHFTSEAERREAAEAIGDDIASQSFVVPNPVELNGPEGDKDDFVRRFPAAAGKKLVLFLSRIDRKKGVELLLKAFAEVKRSEPNVLLVIAGGGDSRYIDILRAQAAELGISADILWTGFLGPAEKADAFAASSVFVLPSHSENFGIAAAEALIAGVPAIVSDQVALADEAGASNAAIVVRCDTKTIANAILELLNDPQKCVQLANDGKAFAEQRFSFTSIGHALRERYAAILEGDRLTATSKVR